MQTQQKSCFRIQSRRKQHKEFHSVVAAFSAGFPACAHLLSLNTTNIISSRTGCVKHNLSENDIFLRGLPARIRRLRRTRPASVALSPSGPPREPSEAVRVGKRSRSGRSELCRWRQSEGSGACGDAVTLRRLRDATLLAPPRKTPCACGATAFSPAGRAVRLLHTPPRFLSRCGLGAWPLSDPTRLPYALLVTSASRN